MMKKIGYLFGLVMVVGLCIPQPSLAATLQERVRGRILLQVESKGEAWYVSPVDNKRYYMKDGAAAYQMMRGFGLGITTKDLASIPSVADENAMKAATSVCATNAVGRRLSGRILLQVEAKGEAWYIHPEKCRRIYMKDGAVAYRIMRFLSLGVTNANLNLVPSGQLVEQVGNWVTFRNRKWGYELKVPSEWKESTETEGQDTFNFVALGPSSTNGDSSAVSGRGISIIALLRKEGDTRTLQQIIDDESLECLEGPSCSTSLLLNDVPAIRVNAGVLWEQGSQIYILAPTIFSATEPIDESLFQQILATLKLFPVDYTIQSTTLPIYLPSPGDNAQATRDSKRISDIKQIQTALELYYAGSDTNSYPVVVAPTLLGATGAKCLSELGFRETCSGNIYMSYISSNPTPGGSDYIYQSINGVEYTLTFTLEGATGSLQAGLHTANQSGIQ